YCSDDVESNSQLTGRMVVNEDLRQLCIRELTAEALSAGRMHGVVIVVELHDASRSTSCCVSQSYGRLFTYEALGFAPPGQGLAMVENMRWRENSEGGKYCEQHTVIGSSVVINPSGGLESKGHPIAATGVAQCVELHRQLTRRAGKRQVTGARVGLQHNFGFGGAAVVTLYRSATPQHKL
ncbi:conserved hypothetical protein, partial [Perkinsus marinus ATCC 50983]